MQLKHKYIVFMIEAKNRSGLNMSFPLRVGECVLLSPAESGEKELDTSLPVRGQITSRDGRRPSIFLRYRDPDSDRGRLRVYPARLM